MRARGLEIFEWKGLTKAANSRQPTLDSLGPEKRGTEAE
jgi:hypothetical protein